MADAARFWDKMAKGYAKRPVADQAAYEEKLKRTRAHFSPASEVLEFGCGTGSTALAHAPHVGHIRATDLSGEMLAIARAKAQEAGITNVSFEQAALDEIEAAPGSLDAVMAMSILHLVADHSDAIAKAYGWLKPGGVFVSSTICMRDHYGWFKWLGPVLKLTGLVPEVKMFSQSELTASLKAAGFTLEDVWLPKPKAAVFIVARKPAA